MKTELIFAGLCLLAATTLRATPDEVVAVEERFAGANDKTFAILRTEIDNLGSLFSSQRKVFLDERSKDGKTTVKSTLLLDEKRDIDVNHEDPETPPPVSVKVLSRNDSISLAALHERFPQQSLEIWNAAKLKRLEAVKKTLGGLAAEDEWKLEEAGEDRNMIYLKLEKETEEGAPETRWISLGLEKSKQLQAQAEPEEE